MGTGCPSMKCGEVIKHEDSIGYKCLWDLGTPRLKWFSGLEKSKEKLWPTVCEITTVPRRRVDDPLMNSVSFAAPIFHIQTLF